MWRQREGGSRDRVRSRLPVCDAIGFLSVGESGLEVVLDGQLPEGFVAALDHLGRDAGGEAGEARAAEAVAGNGQDVQRLGVVGELHRIAVGGLDHHVERAGGLHAAEAEAGQHLIQAVLSRLLSNAAKFTHLGTITLSLTQEADQLHFSVADTGPGIPADKRDFIFERFAKLDSFAQGTGLGLSVARMIAERLGGTLNLDPNYTGGSKFDFITPASFES